MNKIIVGLDIGTASVGYCVLEENSTGIRSLIDMNVRLFNEPLHPKTKNPTNQERREKRQQRRQLMRKSRRKEKLQNFLIKLDLLPSKEALSELNTITDPYELRAKGLDNELTRHEFGRVLYHINQKRGFLSNAKHKVSDEGVVKDSIALLKKQLIQEGCRTIGEFFAKKSRK